MAARTKRRNPVDGAAALAESFLGRPANAVTEFEEELHEHTALADLARLVALYVATDGNPLFDASRCDAAGLPSKAWIHSHGCVKISFDSRTRLAFSEAGRQGFIMGGDQSIDVGEFGLDPEKELVAVGPVAFIEYFTAKEHLGPEDKTPGKYCHAFSEDSKGLLPVLVYDTVNQLCSLAGGTYFIAADLHGKYSAGIRD